MQTDQTDVFADPATAQVEPPAELLEAHRAIMDCDVPRRLTEIITAIGVANRGHFKKRYLEPLVRAGVVAATHPNRPNHPDQTYELTEAGAVLRARYVNGV